MKKSIKAVLLSAFLFPGSGHIFLKKYLMGGVLTVISLVFFIALVSISLDIATELSAQIQSGQISFDIAKITLLIHEKISDKLLGIQSLLFIMLISWVVAIVDSYRIGLIQDKMESK